MNILTIAIFVTVIINTVVLIFFLIRTTSPKEAPKESFLVKAPTSIKRVLKSASGSYVIESKISPTINDDETQWRDELSRKGKDYD